MKGIMYLFFAFMLVACGNAENTETTKGSNEETTAGTTQETTGGESSANADVTTTGTSSTAKNSTASEAVSPFPENEDMALYCKKMLNKFMKGDYNTTTTEMYLKAIDQLGVPAFKGLKLKDAEIRMTNLNYTNKESTLKLAEFICNPVLPKNPKIEDYHSRGKNFFYDKGECGCVQVFETNLGEGQAGHAIEHVFYYKKGNLVAVYDDKDQAVDITAAHKTLSVENLAQFEAIKKIE